MPISMEASVGRISKRWMIALGLLPLSVTSCAGKDQLVGSDRSSAGGPSQSSLSYALSALDLGPGKCLPEPIKADADCKVLTTRSGAACSCSEPGLSKATSNVTNAMRTQLQRVGYCGGQDQAPCSEACACEVTKAIGQSLIECQTLTEPNSDSIGWCYVSADAGKPQTELVAECPSTQKQTLRFLGDPKLLSGEPSFLACVDAGGSAPARAMGEVCSDEFDDKGGKFVVHGVSEVNIIDHAAMCSSGLCVVNHFQGLVSCPYGQEAGAGDCRRLGSDDPLPFDVKPQLVERQAAIASICSCQCAGPGPGPYCTCPEAMQCEHLVDDLGLGFPELSGSYCIPKGTAFDPSASRTECVEPNCGVEHPY